MEFFDQFNESLLIKQIGRPLRLYNVITQRSLSVPDFSTPEAFYFLYERDQVVCVADGKISIYRVSNGVKVTDFGQQTLYTKFLVP